jgi:hypothetical protein
MGESYLAALAVVNEKAVKQPLDFAHRRLSLPREALLL